MKTRLAFAAAAAAAMMIAAPTASFAGGLAHVSSLCPMTWIHADRTPTKKVVKAKSTTKSAGKVKAAKGRA